MTRPMIVPLPFTSPPLSLNDRGHWRPRAARIASVRADVGTAVRAARLTPVSYAVVTLHWRVPDRRKRDLDNMFATLKPAIDALVDVGVLPADDYLHIQPAAVIHPPNGQPASLWIELTAVVPLQAEETA